MSPMAGEDAGRTNEGRHHAVILTPDQRVRVFVSSTIEELAAERAVVRRAIEGVRLSPVLFELGARAHPPRSLYRSYLEQSHVFVGIYWQRYGWVAPGMDVSGLEDEYLLSGPKPKLVYVKRPAHDREPRLAALLDRVRDDDQVSYKSFSLAEDLERVVADDLAALLSEAFMQTPGGDGARPARLLLPADASTFVGRDRELAALSALLARDDVRLVTVTGPGGIGKTRLALRAAADAAGAFEDGATFVSLASLHDPALVPAAIASAVGIRDISPESTFEALRDDLADRSLLLVVDNLEHLLAATDLFAQLLSAAPRLKVLATSREALRIRAEHEFPVPPLAPAEGARLFHERAAAVRHDFGAGDDCTETIARIGRRLDGVPLAIELAAAQVRLLPPDVLLARLDNRLDALAGGARDLPERQRTLRSTIKWSYDLLDADEQQFFATLGVFHGSFSLTAAESVCDDVTGRPVLDVLAALVDKSLLRAEPAAGAPRFRMLATIGDFARECLRDRDDADRVAERHASFYRELSIAVGEGVRGTDQRRWLGVVGPDGDGGNVRAALAWFLGHRRLDDFVTAAWGLWAAAWITGQLEEGRRLARTALAAPAELTASSRARLLAMAAFFDVWTGDHREAITRLDEAIAIGRAQRDDGIVAYATLASSMLTGTSEGEDRAERLAQESLELCRGLNDQWGQAAALNVLGWIYVGQERFDGTESVFEATVSIATSIGDDNFAALGEVNLAEYRLHHGDVAGAAEALAACVRRHRAVRLMYSMPYLLDGAARLVLQRNDPARAARLLGAASRRRESIGVSVWGRQLERRVRLIAEVRTRLGARDYETAFREGAALCYADALAAVSDL
jgi:predicted ATPase